MKAYLTKKSSNKARKSLIDLNKSQQDGISDIMISGFKFFMRGRFIKMKKMFCKIFILMMLLMLCGCGDVSEAPAPDPGDEEEAEKYEVDYLGCKDDFKKAKDSYEEGKKVTLYYDIIATDTDYTFYLDDEVLDVDYSDSKGYIITFIMPDHNVTLRVESRNTMELADILWDTLIDETGATEDEVAAFVRDDFDDDGIEEAFALIGTVSEDWDDITRISGNLWYVSPEGCVALRSSVGLGIGDEARFMTLGDTVYILFTDYFVSESYTYVYSVENGKVSEAGFSGVGYVAPDDKYSDRFTITDSSYDMNYDAELGFMIGHTWKKYYFFYDSETDNVYEFAGTTIDEATVNYWVKDIIVNELVPQDCTIDNIFMRGNGLIVINYENASDDGSISYYHYIYSTEKGSFIDDMGTEIEATPLDGTYQYCLCPDIASYPEVPGPNDIVWYGTANG